MSVKFLLRGLCAIAAFFICGIASAQTITVSAVSGNNAACFGSPSATPDIQEFTASGSALTADITVTAPVNFEVSVTAGSGYATSLTLTQVAGTVAPTIVYIRSAATAPAGAIGGNVTLTSTGAATVNVAVSGIVNPRPTVNAVASQTRCNGTASNAIAFSGSVAGTVYNWTNNDPSIGLAASGSGNIAPFTVTNATTDPVTATITVTPSYTNAGITCTGTPVSFTITVNPTATVDAVPSQQVCAGSLTTAINFSSPNAGFPASTITYSWVNTAPAIGLPSNGTGNIPAFTATNVTTAPLIANITVTPTYTYNGVSCIGSPATFSITVLPTATVNAVANQTLCRNVLTAAINFSSPNTGGTITYNWTNDNINIGLAASGTGNIPSFIATNATASPITGNITVTPVFTSGALSCTGTSRTFSITVDPTPTVNAVGNQLLCAGQNTAPVNFSSSVPGTTYSWVNNNTSIGLAASGNGNIPSFIALGGLNVQTATITVTPTSPSGCIGTTISFTITVNPRPVVDDKPDIALCNQTITTPIIFSSPNTGGTITYNWTNNNTSIGLGPNGSGNIPSFNATNFGTTPQVATITVTPVFTSGISCTGTPMIFTITVNPTPNVNFVGNQLLCAGQSTAPVNFSTTVPATTYSWVNNNTSIGLAASGTGNIASFVTANTGTSPQVATITVTPLYTNAGITCAGTPRTFTITVNPPGAVDQEADRVYCHTNTTSTIIFSNPNSGGSVGYTWTNNNTSIGLGPNGSGNIPAFTANNTGGVPQVATIIVTPTFFNGVSCPGAPMTFTITVNPRPNVNAVGNQLLCAGQSTSAVNFSSSIPGTTYSWVNNNTSIGLAASGTGNIASFVADNTGTSPLVATITVTPLYTNEGLTCAGTPVTFSITVNPRPVVDQEANRVFCHTNTTTTIIFSSPNSGGSVSYTWTNNNTSIGLGPNGFGNLPAFTANNFGTTPQVATIIVTPTFSNGGVNCTGTTMTFTITVNPTPFVNAVSNQLLCAGQNTAAVNFSSGVPGTTYSWVNNNTGIGLAASGTGNIPSFVAANTAISPQVGTITVTPAYTNEGRTCNGAPITFTITVNPRPVVDQEANRVYCHTNTTTTIIFSSPNSGGSVSYFWTNNNTSIGLGPNGSGNLPAFTANNTSTVPQVATIIVTPTFSNGVNCTGTPMTFTITVNPTPGVNSVSNQLLCAGQNTAPVNFSSGVGGTTYSWVNNNTGIGLAASGTGNIPSFVAANTGTSPQVATITVTPLYTNEGVTCAGSPILFTITVNPRPVADAEPNQALCNGSITAPIIFSSPYTGGSVTYNWANNNTSIGLAAGGSGNISSFTAINTGGLPQVAIITVTPVFTNSVSCVGTPTVFTITVNPTPTVNAVADQLFCAGQNTTAVIFGGSVPGTTYNWTNTNTSIGLLASGSGDIPSFVAVNTGSSPAVANITVTPTYTNSGVSCAGAPVTFTITVLPTATVNAVANQTLCNNVLTAAINFSSPNTGGTITYNWTNDNTGIGLAASGSGNIAAFTATNATASPITGNITVTPVFTSGALSCTGTSITFSITVNPGGTVNAVANQVLCANSNTTTVVFSGAVTGTTYNWVNNNTAIGLAASGTGNIPSFTTTNTTNNPLVATITVTPTAPNGCDGSPTTFTMTVYPTATVNPVPNQVVCLGAGSAPVIFSSPTTGGGITYSWVVTQNGSYVTNGSNSLPSFNFSNFGISPLVYTVTVTPFFNNTLTCIGTPLVFTITVNPQTQVGAVNNQVVCNGTATAAVNFTPLANYTGGTITYSWTNNTPSIGLAANGTGNIPSFTAINTGIGAVTATITVTPIFTNGGVSCNGVQRTFTYIVNPTPTVNTITNLVYCNGAGAGGFGFGSPSSGFGTVIFDWTNTNTTIGLAASGSGSGIPFFTATNNGTAPVTATITVTPTFTNGGVSCTGTPRTFTITVNPTANINAVSNQTLCNGASTTAVNFTTNTTGGSVTYNWTNNDPSIGLAASGTGNIPSFTAINNTTSAVTATITVTPVFNNGGVNCNGTPITFTITVNPSASVNTVTNQVFCANLVTSPVTFTSPVPGTTYSWVNNNPSIGLSASGSGNLPSFTTSNTTNSPQVATITVTPSAPNSCGGAPMTFTITVYPVATVNQAPNQVVCSGAGNTPVVFSSPATGGTVTYNWVIMQGLSTVGTGSGNFPSIGLGNGSLSPLVYTVTVTPVYTNGISCAGTPMTFTITVNPVAQINPVNDQFVCNGGATNAVNFTSLTTGGTVTYNWINTNPSIGLPANGSGNIPSFTAINTGASPVGATIIVTAVFTNGGVSCNGNTMAFNYIVNPTPTVDAVPNQVVCNGANTTAVNFTSPNSGGGITFNWTNSNTTIGLAASGTGNIPSFTATNNGTAPVTATITVTPIFSNGPVNCTGTPRTFTITVNPTANVNAVSNQTLCNGAATTAVNFTTNATGGSVSYNWTNNDPSIGLAASGTGNIPSFTATNTGTTAVTATLVVTPVFNNGGVNCNGTPMTFTITVNPSATVNAVLNQILCANVVTTAIAFSSPVAGTTYSWVNNNTAIGLAASGTGNIPSFTTSNTSNNPLVATITVTPSAPNSCGGAPITFTITVNPVATITAVPNVVVCHNGTVAATNFSSPATGGTVTYAWTNNNTSIGLAASGTGNIAAFTATNTGTAPVTATITVTPTYTNGAVSCAGTPTTYTITVNPVAVINAVADQTLCNGATTSAVNFTSTATGGTVTYSWTNNTTSIGLPANGTGNIAAFTAVNTGTSPVTATITVTPTFTNGGVSCAGTPITFTYTVNPTATVNAVANQVVCNGATTTAVNFTSSNGGGSVTYAWTNTNTSIGLAASGSGNIAAFTATNTGTALVTTTITVTPTFTNGGVSCAGTPITFTITVNPTANVNAVSNQSLCNGAATTAVNFTTNTTGGSVTFNWVNNTPSIGLAASGSGNIPSFTAVNTGTSAVTATITVTPVFNNGGVNCTGTPMTFTITVNPSSSVNPVANQVFCANVVTSPIVFSSPVAGTTYSWTNNNTAIGLGASGNGNIPSFTTSNTTNNPLVATIIVTPSTTSGCGGAPVTFTITVNPVATVTPVANQVLCAGSTTNAVNFSSPATGGTVTYAWTNNNTSIGLAASGTGNIAAFTATNAGNSPVTATITVTPTYTNGAVSCVGTPTTFTITVNPSTGVTVNAVPNQVLCNGTSTTAINFSSNASGGTVTYNWTNNNTTIGLGASGTGNIPAFTVTNTGTAPVVATITVTPTFSNGGAGCPGTPTTFTITVNPTATVNAVANQVVCNGATTTAVNFTSSNSGGTVTYAWTNTNTSIGLAASGSGNIAAFTATNTGTAPVTTTITVTPTFTNGGVSCAGSSTTFTITVNPTANVNAVSNQTLCNGSATTAVNFSTNATGGSVTYNWTNSTPSIGLATSGSGNIPSFVAVNNTTTPVTATINVTPVLNNGGINCTGTPMTFTITVNPSTSVNPVANQILCANVVTSPIVFSSPVAGTTYNWTNNNTAIGLGVSGTGNIPSFTTSNTTNNPLVATIIVTPSTTSGCGGASTTFTITINPVAIVTPVANQVLCAGSTTNAVNFSSPATGGTVTYAWTNNNTSIGLAASGTGNIAAFAATNAGTSPVTATITVTPTYTNGAVSCVGIPTTFTITVNPSTGVTVNTVPNQVLCNGTSTTAINFSSDASGGTVTYNWTNNNTTIGLGASGTGNIPAFTVTNTGTAPVVATITVTPTFSNGGAACTGTPTTFTITVNPTATVNAVANQAVCNGATTTAVNFTSPATGGTVTYAWTNTNTSIGLVASGTGNIAAFIATNNGTAPATATITVTPTFTNGGVSCAGTPTTFTITVNPTPIVNPVGNQSLCNGANTTAVNFGTTATGGSVTFNWTNSVPSIGLAASGSGNIPSFAAVNTGTTPVVATITVTPVFNNGGVNCTGTPIIFTITVNPTATVNAVANQVFCGNSASSPITFSGAVAGTVFNWVNNNTAIGLGASGSGNIPSFTTANNFVNPTTATITVTPVSPAGCVGAPIQFTITILPVATVSTVANQVLCNGSSTNAIIFSSPAVGGTVTYAWVNNTPSIGIAASGTGNIPSFIAVNTGLGPITATITVTPTYTNGATSCVGVASTFTITVNPTAVVNAVANQVLCNSATTAAITFSSPNTIGAGSNIVFNWTNNTPSIGLSSSGSGNINPFTAVNNTTAPVVATIIVTPAYTNAGVSCPGASITFTITVNPTATANPIANQSLCNNTPTAAVNFSTIYTGGTVVYNWVNNTPSIGLAATGSGNIASFIATNATNNPVTATITVTPTFTNAGVSCVGMSSTFTITVNPSGNVNAIANQVHCANATTLPIVFTSGVSGTTYTWVNNNPSIGLAASGVGNIPGFVTANNLTNAITATITVTPISPNGCAGLPITFTITVNPIATVNPVANQVLCNGSSTAAIAFSSPATGGTVQFSWTNNTPSIGLAANGVGNIPTFIATNTTINPVVATITVTPTFINGGVSCVGTASTFTITVNPTATANLVPAQVLCNGSSTTPITFTSPNGGNGGSNVVFNWSNNTPSIGLAASGTGNIASFIATNTTTAPVIATITVTPTYTNGGVSCAGVPMTSNITVNPTATANPVANQSLCNGVATAAVNFSTIYTGGSVVYNWVNNTPSIGLAATGSGNIASFIATNTSTTQVTATITVTPTFTSGGVSCVGTSSTFTITVNPPAVVNPVANQSLCANTTTTPIVFSSPVSGTTYTWVNNNTAIGLAASGAGNIPSFVTVNTVNSINATITVTPNSPFGCTGLPITFVITVNPIATVNPVPVQVLCNGRLTDSIKFSSPNGNNGGGNIIYNWVNNTPSIGLAASGSGNINPFTATNTGTVPVIALITVTPSFVNGSTNCVGIPITFSITVNPTAVVNVIANQTVCAGQLTSSVTLTGPVAGTTYTWTNSNPLIGLAASGSGNIAAFVAQNPTFSTITGTITVTPNTPFGCIGTPRSFDIIVPALSVAPTAISTPALVLCDTNTVTTLRVVGGGLGTGANWVWYRDACGGTPIGTGAVLNNVTVGNTTTFYVRAEGTCNITACASVTVQVAKLITHVRQHWNDVLFFDNSSNNFVKWQWYKNNTLVPGATLQHYTEPGGLNGTYYVVATDRNGLELLTCPLDVAPGGFSGIQLKISPNPVGQGQQYRLISSLTPADLQGAAITVRDILGSVVAQSNTNTPITTLQAPTTAGMYIVTLNLRNGQKYSVTMIVR